MRVLIDTHVLIWHLEDDSHLPLVKSALIDDEDNEILISVASLWEIAIKTSLGKLKLSRPIAEIIDQIHQSTGSILAIEPYHATQVSTLPFHHKDPFDRMIIAQALSERLPIITLDPAFSNYGVNLL